MSSDKSKTSKYFVYLVGAGFALIIGFSFFGIKMCVPYADSLTILTYRYISALIGASIWILVLKAIGRYPKAEPGRPKGKLYLTAFFYIMFMVLQVLAMFFATSIEGAIVYAMVPIFAKIIGRIALGEKSTRLQMVFICLTVSALITLILFNATDINLNLTGLILMTISSIFMACQNVSARYIRGVFRPIEITITIAIGGSVVFIGATLIRAIATGNWAALVEPLKHADFVIWVAFLGIGCILLSAQFMAYMLSHMEIVQSTVFNSASTLVSIVAGTLILGEPLMWYHYLCGAIILVGVVGMILAPAKAENAGKSLADDLKN